MMNVHLYVITPYNKKEIRQIGARLKELRLALTTHSVEDVADMTGIPRNTISAIENGSNTNLFYFLEVTKAIGVTPIEVFEDLTFSKKPKYKLPPNKLAKESLTKRVNKVYTSSTFFDDPKFVSEIATYLKSNYNFNTVSSAGLSVILGRMVSDGKLTFTLVGRSKHYIKIKNKPN